MKQLFLIIFLTTYYLTSCSPVKIIPAEEIQTIIDSADTNYKEENYDLAETDLIMALSTAEKEYGKESREAADIYLKLAMYSTAYKKAIDYTQSAEAIYEKLNDMNGLAETYETYALMYDRKHKPELAQKAYEKALLYCDKSTDDMSDKKFHIYLSLAPLDHLTDEESLNYGIEAEKLLDKLAEKDKNAGSVLVYTSLGNSYYNMEEDYEKEKNLTSKELDELIMLKEALKELYERLPYAEKQDFESWYLEQIK